MKYGSVCSGIEAASVAWESLGWSASFLSEIEPFPRSVLTHHYPSVPLHGDFTTIEDGMYESIDLLVGGTPCQSFSVAGLRKGLDDPRGNLMLEFGALAKRLSPKWLVWENVPGVLSSNGGRDFGAFLGMLVELGYGFAYRVLDAQYFGLAQRRRRVFVVGCFGDWRSAAAVLFERESLHGNPAPSREKREEVAGWPAKCAPTLNAAFGSKLGLENQHIDGGAGLFVQTLCVHGTQDPCVSDSTAFALGRNNGQENAVAFAQNSRDEVRLIGGDGQISGALAAQPGMKQTTYLAQSMAVRRLTPTECERLQGFPDNYTQVPHRGKPAADGPRYKALGNSMAVPCMAWIGKRIALVESIHP
jgi:DNA (cytosine-5)-methyltransferase 1